MVASRADEVMLNKLACCALRKF